MRKKRDLLTDEQRTQRFEQLAQNDADGAVAEDKAIDAMIKRSIELHGP
jgi:hypothetical protein